MAALICGSLAFDSIATFPGRFADQILPEQLHILNVSFLVPTLRREFGGCAGNIAYNLAPLGGEPRGAGGGRQRRRRLPGAACSSWGHEHRSRAHVAGSFTAQAFIITDLDNNQITAFHPGAMQSAHEIAVPARSDLAPGDHRARRPRGDAASTPRQLAAAGDPVHLRSRPGPADVRRRRARRVRRAGAPGSRSTTTKPRCSRERTGRSLEAMSRSHLRGIVVTLGAHGCDVWQQRRAHARARRHGERGRRPDRLRRRLSRAPCCTASSATGRWSAAPASATASAPSRSPAAAARIMCWIARSSRA